MSDKDDNKLPKDCENDIYSAWEYMKILAEQMEDDVYKSSDGNLTASVRFRKGLKLMKAWIPQLRAISVKCDHNIRKKKSDKLKSEGKKRGVKHAGEFGLERDPKTRKLI